LQAIQKAYVQALDNLSRSSDAKTVENLNRLCSTPLAEIESGKWQGNLSNLEADLLRRNIEETRKIRIALYEVLFARIVLHRDWLQTSARKPLAGDALAAVRQVQECLKPRRFLEVRFSVEELSEDDRLVLRDYEKLNKAAAAGPNG
jgi:hypothetical protein